jgi:hypothetical protein
LNDAYTSSDLDDTKWKGSSAVDGNSKTSVKTEPYEAEFWTAEFDEREITRVRV